MEYICSLRKISLINSAADKFFERKIQEKKLPISQTHLQLFFILPEDGTALFFNEVAALWDISKSSLSTIIQKYENNGLIRKCVCTEDKRSIYISMTPEAVSIKRTIEAIETEFLMLILKDFGENEIGTFKKMIDHCYRNIP